MMNYFTNIEDICIILQCILEKDYFIPTFHL